MWSSQTTTRNTCGGICHFRQITLQISEMVQTIQDRNTLITEGEYYSYVFHQVVGWLQDKPSYLYSVSIHQKAPPKQGIYRTSGYSLLLIYRPRNDERLS